MRKVLIKGAVVAGIVALTFAGVSASASPSRDVVKRGACSGSSHWKLDLSRQGTGRIEADMEIHSGTAGEKWHFGFKDNGTWFGGGTRATQTDGSVDMRRNAVNQAGVDAIRVKAKNLKTGETCTANASATF